MFAYSGNYEVKFTKFNLIAVSPPLNSVAGVWVVHTYRTAIKIMRVQKDSQVKIMEPSQPQQRHAAAKSFEESLDQLQQILEDNQTEDETAELDIGSATNVEAEEDFTAIDLAAFEDAVADIEQYLEKKRIKTQE